MIIRQILLLFFLISTFSGFSQTEENFPTMNISGTLKSKAEFATVTDEMRFSVRNARLAFRGNVAPLVSYHALFELSSLGNFQMLDLAATIQATENLSFTFGQLYIPFLDAYISSPAQMMFANYTFAVGLIGNRDIGLSATYTFNVGDFPIALNTGVFNANTINAPVWVRADSLSFKLRANFGDMTGFRTSIKMYNYPNATRGVHHFFYGATARYEASNWRIDSEVLWRNDRNNSNLNMVTSYIQAAYIHPIRSRLFNAVVPAFRWDTLTQSGSENSGIDVNRFTTGLGFTLTNMPWTRASILRFDYEWFVVNNRLPDFFRYPAADSNKFTVELVLNF